MIPFINQIADAWWGWMGAMLWQVSLLIVLVSLIDLLIGKWAWPPVRYALWLLILLKLLIPPTWSLTTSVVSRTVPWAQHQIVQAWASEPVGLARQAAVSVSSTTPSEDALTAAGAAEIAPPGKSRPAGLAWRAWAMVAWLLGMGVFAVLLATRISKLRRWHREQAEKKTIPPWFHELMVRTARRINLDRLPAIVFSAEAVTPAVYGVFRPVLLLPAGYTESLSEEEAEHVLLHELAHLKRGDLWLHGLCLLLQIVYWFNPLLIWVRKQMRHVRELCCDLTVASVLREKTTAYRKTLLNTARELLTESLQPGMGLLGVFEEPFRLVARLRWLERNTWRQRRWMMLATGPVVLLMVPFFLPMAAVEPDRAVAAWGAEDLSAARDGGDLYIREVARNESYFLGFLTGAKTLHAEQAWIGKRRAAFIERGKTLILDLDRGLLWWSNPDTRTYIEASLPLDADSLLSAEVKQRRLTRSEACTVRETGRSRAIAGTDCREYAYTTWNEIGGARSDIRRARVWAADDVPVDLNAYYELLDIMRILYGRDEEVREELNKIRGPQLRLEMSRGNFLSREKFVLEAVEIARIEPPDDVYSVPEGYTRKERLTADDF